MSFVLQKGDTGESTFRSSGNQIMGAHVDSYTLEGQMGEDSTGVANVTIRLTYSSDQNPIAFQGKFYVAEGTVEGNWKFAHETLGGDFVFKRSPQYLRFRSSPAVIRKSPALVRWKFAMDAVHDRVKKDLWSRSYFMGRFRDRRRYVELGMNRPHHDRHDRPGSTNSANFSGWTELHQRLSPADVQFYASIVRHDLQQNPVHE